MCFFVKQNCFCFSDSTRSVVEREFGSVYEGGTDLVALSNLSTQAILELVRNVPNDVGNELGQSDFYEAGFDKEVEPDQSEFVVVGLDEIDAFDICQNGMKMNSGILF